MENKEKTILEHVNDFFDGVYNTAVETPINFGDFLARISGFRDHQINNSVMDLDNPIQRQALNELTIIYEASTNPESLTILKDFILDDIQNRPVICDKGERYN